MPFGECEKKVSYLHCLFADTSSGFPLILTTYFWCISLVVSWRSPLCCCWYLDRRL